MTEGGRGNGSRMWRRSSKEKSDFHERVYFPWLSCRSSDLEAHALEAFGGIAIAISQISDPLPFPSCVVPLEKKKIFLVWFFFGCKQREILKKVTFFPPHISAHDWADLARKSLVQASASRFRAPSDSGRTFLPERQGESEKKVGGGGGDAALDFPYKIKAKMRSFDREDDHCFTSIFFSLPSSLLDTAPYGISRSRARRDTRDSLFNFFISASAPSKIMLRNLHGVPLDFSFFFNYVKKICGMYHNFFVSSQQHLTLPQIKMYSTYTGEGGGRKIMQDTHDGVERESIWNRKMMVGGSPNSPLPFSCRRHQKLELKVVVTQLTWLAFSNEGFLL